MLEINLRPYKSLLASIYGSRFILLYVNIDFFIYIYIFYSSKNSLTTLTYSLLCVEFFFSQTHNEANKINMLTFFYIFIGTNKFQLIA